VREFTTESRNWLRLRELLKKASVNLFYDQDLMNARRIFRYRVAPRAGGGSLPLTISFKDEEVRAILKAFKKIQSGVLAYRADATGALQFFEGGSYEWRVY
jgi:hypothetical protein